MIYFNESTRFNDRLEARGGIPTADPAPDTPAFGSEMTGLR